MADRKAVLAAVGDAVGHDGAPVVGARLLDADVDLRVVVDEAEHERRLAARAGRGDDWDLLDLLLMLPRCEPVPLLTLSSQDREVLARVPRGFVDVAGDCVTRVAGPPTVRVLAVVTDAEWDRGLDTASRFAPVATRVLALSRRPDELARVVAEAVRYGIGLALVIDGSVRVILDPEPWRENRLSLGGWLFREEAYWAYVDASCVGRGGPPRPAGWP